MPGQANGEGDCASQGGAVMNPLSKIVAKVGALRRKKTVAPVAQTPQPGTLAYAQWQAWVAHQSIYKASICFDDFVAKVWDSDGYADMLSQVLHREVYQQPERYNRGLISSTLDLIEQLYPNQKQELMQDAFRRVLEEAADDEGTWVVNRFLQAGASVDWPQCLIRTIWQAGYTGDAQLWRSKRHQVVVVVRCLIEGGADPDKPWPEFSGLSVRQYLSGLKGGFQVVGALELLEEAEQHKILQLIVPPAAGAAKARRL